MWGNQQNMNIADKVLEKIRQTIKGYEEETIEIVEGLFYSQYETLRKIEFYWNSRYISGQKDELGRVKPFYNISKFRVNVATRATDLDIKDVKVTSDDPGDRVRSLVFNKEIYNWMKEVNFGRTLNISGQTRAKYGGVIIKKIEKDKKLDIQVVEWKNIITDQTDILGGIIIEKHYMSAVDLSKKKDVWENIPKALKLFKDKNKIEVYEVHGEFPETYLEEYKTGDENNYRKMMFIVAGKQEQIPLYQEEEDELPYKYLPWDKISGRGLGGGVVEDGFEAQQWTNEAIIAEKNVMDLVGKVYIKTNSENIGGNIHTDTDNGTIFKLEDGEDANVMQLAPNSLPQFQNLVDKWNIQYERQTNTFDSVSGETLPSNTPLGSVAIQTAQASSFFDYRREEAGIFWREVFNDWVLPSIAKKINKAHILASDYSPEEIELIQKAFSKTVAFKKVEDLMKKGQPTMSNDYATMIENLTNMISENGDVQFLEVPDGYFTDFKPKITIDLTGESKNKQENLTSLFNVLTQIASNPALLQDPNLIQIFNQMLELSNIRFTPKPVAQPVQGQSKQITNNTSALEKQTKSVLPEAQQ